MSSNKQLKQSTKLTLVSNENGFHDFDVSNAGSVTRVTVGDNISFGDMFNIHYGDGHYVPKRKEGAKWLGRNGVLEKDVIKSIHQSAVYKGESVCSEHFYKKVTDKYCLCQCTEPSVRDCHDPNERKVIAVDLQSPKYSRTTSRYIIYLSACSKCGHPLTHGTGIGSFFTTGEEKLKSLAEGAAKISLDFDNLITSAEQLI